MANGCQHLCDVDDEKLLCQWLCKTDKQVVDLLFISPDTGCKRESFLDCVAEDKFDDMCYVAGGCLTNFKFGSAFYCLELNPGDNDCLINNGLSLEDISEVAVVAEKEEIPQIIPALKMTEARLIGEEGTPAIIPALELTEAHLIGEEEDEEALGIFPALKMTEARLIDGAEGQETPEIFPALKMTEARLIGEEGSPAFIPAL